LEFEEVLGRMRDEEAKMIDEANKGLRETEGRIEEEVGRLREKVEVVEKWRREGGMLEVKSAPEKNRRVKRSMSS
jgi:hypothetical protein